jgi:hypothetical protein
MKSLMIALTIAAFYMHGASARTADLVDDADLMQWSEVPDMELNNLRGGFYAEVGEIGIDLAWVVQVDVDNTRIFSHDVTSDFVGKVVNIDSAGNFEVSDFQSLALVLQNSQDGIAIEARQLLDVQLSNIEVYKKSLFTSQFNHDLTQSILR